MILEIQYLNEHACMTSIHIPVNILIYEINKEMSYVPQSLPRYPTGHLSQVGMPSVSSLHVRENLKAYNKQGTYFTSSNDKKVQPNQLMSL